MPANLLRGVAVLLLLLLTACSKPAPESFTVNTGDEVIDSTDLLGQVVYLDFWATWCAPCRESFPWMREMQTKYGESGLRVIAVSLDTNHQQAGEFAAELGANFTIGFDDSGGLANQFEVRGMPTSVVIGRDGRKVETHTGFNKSKVEQYEATIKAALEAG